MDLASIRPSPVKFTSQRPEQYPIRPEPERGVNPQIMAEAMRHKMLSLENLKGLPDFGKFLPRRPHFEICIHCQ
jgi:hypothetical protein